MEPCITVNWPVVAGLVAVTAPRMLRDVSEAYRTVHQARNGEK